MRISTFALTALTVICIPATVIVAMQPARAEATYPEPLQVQMKLVSAKTFAPGEPVVVHYTITNASLSDEAALTVGDNGNEWYNIKAVDAAGRLVPPRLLLAPQVRRQEGSYQSAERTLAPGQKVEGNIVASDFLPVTLPGQYSLHVGVSLAYIMKPTAEEASAETIDGSHKLSVDFAFRTTVTAKNPATVRAVAEQLRRQLLDATSTENSKTTEEELFAMPALPVWQSLVTDPATNDIVLTDAAEQLSLRPSRSSADLVAQILWEPGAGPETRSVAQNERIWSAMSRIYDTAPPSLKPYIQSLYIEHGVSAPELKHPAIKSHPN